MSRSAKVPSARCTWARCAARVRSQSWVRCVGFGWRGGALPPPRRAVVLKKAKRGVENAQEMQEAELYMNARVARDTGGACAAFLGVVRVQRGQSSGRLVSGLWLVWAYEGRYTLSSHLRSPTYPRALGAALYGAPEALDEFEDPELAVAQTVMTQLLNALRQMHAAGLVHRDVKVRLTRAANQPV